MRSVSDHEMVNEQNYTFGTPTYLEPISNRSKSKLES